MADLTPEQIDHIRARSVELTHRELQILKLRADGLSCRMISEELGITFERVKHISLQTLRRLGADNMPHAVALAMRRKIIE